MRTMQALFQISRREFRLLTIFLAFTAFCSALLWGRMRYTGEITFQFLLWNLFLAWLPLGFAAAATRFRPIAKRTWLLLPCLAAWLLFFPNAPYILTDLFHLRERPGAPHWFDILLVVSFAIHGLLLGLASLRVVHQMLDKRFKPFFAWLLLGTAVTASAYGIYLGWADSCGGTVGTSSRNRKRSWPTCCNPSCILFNTKRPSP